MQDSLANAVTPCPTCRRQMVLTALKCPECGAAADTTSPFVSFRRPDGSGGMIDQLTVSYLRSPGGKPSQKDLDELFTRASRVDYVERVFDGRVSRLQPRHKFATPVALSGLQKSMVLRDVEVGHLMTFGTFQLDFFEGETLLAEVEVVGNYLLRWPQKWKNDAPLEDPRLLADYLNSAGFPSLSNAIAEADADAKKRGEEHAAWAATWEATTPAGLASFADHFTGLSQPMGAGAVEKALSTLQSQYGSRDDAILALFAWYGHRPGPWSGYPAIEAAPETLLQAFSPEQLASALESRESTLTNQHMEGAARFVSRWVQKSRSEAQEAVIDRFRQSPVRQRLVDYLGALDNESKIRAMSRAFSTKGPAESPHQKKFYPVDPAPAGPPNDVASKKES